MLLWQRYDNNKMADMLLWQRYDNNKMVAMRYYSTSNETIDVFYISRVETPSGVSELYEEIQLRQLVVFLNYTRRDI